MILEVNASPGLEGIEKVSGKDIAGMMVDYVLPVCKKELVNPALLTHLNYLDAFNSW